MSKSVRDEGATKGNPYFTGLPTPAAGALVALLPLLISLPVGPIRPDRHAARVSGAMIALTSMLMVSRLPTPSIKYMKLQRQHRLAGGNRLCPAGGCVDRLALGDDDHRAF